MQVQARLHYKSEQWFIWLCRFLNSICIDAGGYKFVKTRLFTEELKFEAIKIINVTYNEIRSHEL